MPKNIPGIVQRKPRQDAPVAIRIQPPPFPAQEPAPSAPSEPPLAPNSAPYAGPMASSFSTPPVPMNVEQYGGPVTPPSSMPPMPMSAEPYLGPMAPFVPSVPGMQQQMMPPTQLVTERTPQQSMPASVPGMPPGQANEASANANTPFSRKGMLSSRGFMPSAPAGNNTLPPPSPMMANNPPTPPLPAAASNPPTPQPSMSAYNPLTPMPPALANSSVTLRPSSAGSESHAPLTPVPASARAMAGQQVARQGQPPRARILIELDGKVSGEVFLQKPALTVGRLSTSDIYIASKRISRQHARIVAEQGAWVIEDAGSINGLFYNGSHMKRLVLSHGDHIRLSPDAAIIYEVIH